MKIKNAIKKLTIFEMGLWCASVLFMVLSFVLVKSHNYASVIGAIIGVTALIFTAKGEVAGQLLIVVFSVFYGVVSYACGYYGEMITYIGMTTPIAIMSVVSWLKNPFGESGNEVEVKQLHGRDMGIMIVSTILVTIIFYYILRHLKTANLFMSTVSISTSFLASYLTYQRSSFYAIAYGANDIVLIILWVLASLENVTYLPMVVCFVIFFINDMYGFYSWQKMQKKQQEILSQKVR